MDSLYILLVTLLLYQTGIRADDYRLPNDVLPTSYVIDISLNQTAFTSTNDQFDGVVIININVTSDNTSEIKLHSSYEYINISTLLVDNNAENISYSVNSTTDILTISFESNTSLSAGEHVLRVSYEGLLSTSDMYGFYKSSYNNSENQTVYLATTQFQPTHARRAFPCFDEPAFKATFNVSLTYPAEFNALSNNDVFNSSSSNSTGTNLTTTEFETTPIMSTYLLAFIISNFTCTVGESIEGDNVTYSVCSREELQDSRAWAIEMGPPILRSLNSFTNYNYSVSLSKMDQVAIPDFSAGAMENWGLVTYRERGLLWDQNESSNAYKQYTAAVIAHEFAHQWFGNLVTMKWWSESFLNEGFATYFEYFTTHEVLPDWEMDKQFVLKELQYIFESDSYTSAQALQSNASTPSEISAKFGTITYSKGGSIFRMVEHILGSTNYKAGLQTYLATYNYMNSEPEDLWTTFNATVNVTELGLPADLNTVMKNWVTKSGFPVLDVYLNGTSLSISQQRFLFSGNDSESEWYIPISYSLSTDTDKFESTSPTAWLVPGSNLTINLTSEPEWIILNNQQTGYYRVNYDTSMWNNISTALLQSNFSGIHVINRAQIVDDAMNLARAGHIQYSLALSILNFLQNDTSYYSWYPAFSQFDYLLKRVGQNTLLGSAISAHILHLMENLRSAVNLTSLNDTDQVYTLNQVLANTWACKLGHSECVSTVQTLFEQYKNTSERPNKNLRSIVYCNALRYSSDSDDWEFLWNAYQNTDIATEKVTILSALGCSVNETILEAYLLKSITDNSGIRSQDSLSVFSAVYSSNDEGVDVALTFFINNYQAISESYNSMNSLGNLLKGIAGRLYTEAQITQLQDFIANTTLDEDFTVSANEAVTIAQANLAWLTLYKEELLTFYGITEDSTDASTNSTTASTEASTGDASTNSTTTVSPEESTDDAESVKASLLLLVVVLLRKFLYEF